MRGGKEEGQVSEQEALGAVAENVSYLYFPETSLILTTIHANLLTSRLATCQDSHSKSQQLTTTLRVSHFASSQIGKIGSRASR